MMEFKDNEKVFVNVYKVTRHFGGYEEGGWYYNRTECVGTLHEPFHKAQGSLKELRERCKKKSEGDIYSVDDGVEYWAAIEKEDAESEDIEVPRYE